MRMIEPNEIDRLLDFGALIDALHQAFASDIFVPPRHHHELRHGSSHATHLLMPAWSANTPGTDAFLGTKVVNIFPDNGTRELPSVTGVYVLQSGETGVPLAIMDGARLTLWRTAATSAMAARVLARPEASHLLMVGAGALAPFLIKAHAAVRPITQVTLWNHRRASAERLAVELGDGQWRMTIADDLAAAVGAADIVCCATLSPTPLVRGRWLRPGTHLDLVGAFNLSMREVDDEAIAQARIFIDTDAAKTEGGDIAVALRSGVIVDADVAANLFDLCRQRKEGRRTAAEVTLFKSIGTGVEDLAAAILVWRRAQAA